MGGLEDCTESVNEEAEAAQVADDIPPRIGHLHRSIRLSI
jgi:hypothetical protein